MSLNHALNHSITDVLITYLGGIEDTHLLAMGKKHMVFTLDRGDQTFHNYINNHNYGKVIYGEVLLQNSQGIGGEQCSFNTTMPSGERFPNSFSQFISCT